MDARLIRYDDYSFYCVICDIVLLYWHMIKISGKSGYPEMVRFFGKIFCQCHGRKIKTKVIKFCRTILKLIFMCHHGQKNKIRNC